MEQPVVAHAQLDSQQIGADKAGYVGGVSSLSRRCFNVVDGIAVKASLGENEFLSQRKRIFLGRAQRILALADFADFWLAHGFSRNKRNKRNRLARWDRRKFWLSQISQMTQIFGWRGVFGPRRRSGMHADGAHPGPHQGAGIGVCFGDEK
jgi:hypothetical protein